jgi:nicotinic acid mononucleotide adenylyltransferase
VVLVSCGSFNPPTIMHLRMCELAADALGQVRWRDSRFWEAGFTCYRSAGSALQKTGLGNPDTVSCTAGLAA